MWTWIIVLGGGGVHISGCQLSRGGQRIDVGIYIGTRRRYIFIVEPIKWIGRETDRQTGSSADKEGILLCKTNIPVVNNVWSFVMWRDKFAVGEVFVRSNG